MILKGLLAFLSIALVTLIFSSGIIPAYSSVFFQQAKSLSDEFTPARQQMKMHNDPIQIVCREGMGMIMSSSTGDPACVSPTTYMRLVDRGYGHSNFNFIVKDQQFMQGIMNNMMYHPRTMGYMMNDPQILEHIRGNTQWRDIMRLDSTKGPGMMGGPMGPGMMRGQGMGPGMIANYTIGCSWCPVESGTGMQQGWMMHNPQHMHEMTAEMMNNPELRQQMLDHMMHNQQFMQQLMQNHTFMEQFTP